QVQEPPGRAARAPAEGPIAPVVVPVASPPEGTETARRRSSECRVWATELDAARGPKPLAVIERLFVSRYVPLAEAVARGETDAAARAVLASWSISFAKSYTEAFGALRVTGKRPLMVLDAPQMANRIGRLHGAKSTQLVLVDAMRFDLGLRVHERLRPALG